MWRKEKHHNTLVLSISPHYVRALFFKNHTNRPHLCAYQKNRLEHLEFENLILFNPTRIAKLITTFVSSHQSSHTKTHIILNGPSLSEQFISLPLAHPTINQFPISYEPKWHWEYQYLYPYDHNYYFYVCGIQKQLLLQYQLLALHIDLNLQSLTSERIGLLKIYRFLFGSAFRRAHLGTDLMAHNNKIEQLFTKDDLSRTLSIANDIVIEEHDMIPLLAACGLIVGSS